MSAANPKPPNPKPQCIYLPIEISSRELDARLLVAIQALKNGIDVVMGQKWLLFKNAWQTPPGYWIFKTLLPSDAKHMKRLAAYGHIAGAIDEEMPGLGEGGGDLRWVKPDSVEACDAVFCMGDVHHGLMTAKYPQHAAKMIKTGNPRWDVLRPELRALYDNDAKAIKAEWGDFILINTNSGLINSDKNDYDKFLKRWIEGGKIDPNSALDMKFIDDLYEFDHANFKAIPPMMRTLTEAFPDKNIILRPHPSERVDTYEREFVDHPRIHVVRERPAAAWLSACDVLIHTSCTTASEAFALGVPSICYETIPSVMNTYLLSSALSKVAKTEAEIVADIKGLYSEETWAYDADGRREVFHRFFAGQAEALSSKLIIDHIKAQFATDADGTIVAPPWKPGVLFRSFNFKRSKFQARTFPDYPATEISARLNELISTMGEPMVPTVTRCGTGLYHLSVK